MAIVISNTKQILERLRLEGKVKIMNSKEDHERRVQINEKMLKIKKDYLIKAHSSEQSAAKFFIL